jgi:glucose-6-phosphate dehydrogenase assembly protein OpcA
MSAVAVRPDKLLKELDELWRNLGHEQASGVLRACSMTLVVLTEGTAHDVGETLALLMRDHPARAIVLCEQPGDVPRLDAAVRAQCWMPFGRRQQICCELIEITMTASSVTDAVPLVRSLTAPDLPVSIWCRSPRLVGSPEFEPILCLANKLILDSRHAADPRSHLRYIQAAEDTDTFVADLAWTSLTAWRSAIARHFERSPDLDRLSAINEIIVGYRGTNPPLSSYYMAAWLKHALKTSLIPLLTPAETDFVTLRAPAWEVSFDAPPHTPSEYELLREELAISSRDPLYVAARRLAAELLG